MMFFFAWPGNKALTKRMKQLAIFIQKELWHIVRDRRSLIILLGMPVVLVLLFGFAITNEIDNGRLAILDRAGDEVSRTMTGKLQASGYFKLVNTLSHSGEVEPAFRSGAVQLVVVFPPDLANALRAGRSPAIQLLADASDPNAATTLISYASSILRSYRPEGASAMEAIPLRVLPEIRMLYNPRLEGVYMFVPGVMTVILMLVSAMMTSIALTREKEMGTMEVLLASPLPPWLIVIGKVLPYVILALSNTIVILLLGTLVFKMPVVGSGWLLAGECLLFISTSLALGILISTRTASQQVAMMISLMALMLPTILLSGFIFPIESMPTLLQWISHIVPAKWFIIILKGIMLKGVGMAALWQETAILVGMTVFLLAISIANFKIRIA